MGKRSAIGSKQVSQERASASKTRSAPAPKAASVDTGVGIVRSSARGFDVGGNGRRLRTIPTTVTAINTLIRRYGSNVVARSRWLATNNPFASSAKEAYIAAMVGTGIKPSWLGLSKDLKKNLQKAFKRWTDEADADQLTDLYGMQALIAAELFEAGECFGRFRDRRPEDGLSVPLQIQLLPCEMLPVWFNEVTNQRRIECGIEFDAIGRRVAYHFLRRHPGSDISAINFAPSMTVRVPAEEVVHIFRPIRVGQIRGIPHTLAGMVTLAMLDLYEDAELERKRIAALFAAFIKREKKEDVEDHPFKGTETTTRRPTTSATSQLEPGAVIDLFMKARTLRSPSRPTLARTSKSLNIACSFARRPASVCLTLI
jgi:lambda family phage portal protein